MQNRSKILALSLATVALAACSSMQEKPSYAAQSSVVSPADASIDTAYVANVEYIAKQRGVEVRWVHMPKRVPNSQ
jgi:uncharacterized protein YcfL